MARKRTTEAPALKDWEDVDGALKEIAEAQLAIGDIEAELDRQVNGVKAVAAQESKPHHDRVAKPERDLKDFVEEHQSNLGKSRARTFDFGEVDFQLSTSVSIPKTKEEVMGIIRHLEARQVTDCIIAKKKISKGALKKYGEDTVNAVGAMWKQKDAFGYETYGEKPERTF